MCFLLYIIINSRIIIIIIILFLYISLCCSLLYIILYYITIYLWDMDMVYSHIFFHINTSAAYDWRWTFAPWI